LIRLFLPIAFEINAPLARTVNVGDVLRFVYE
jgi:hypothetical protein